MDHTFKEAIDYITEKMPFRAELLEYCKEHPNFVEALKLLNTSRFQMFGGVTTSSSPKEPEDEVIGIVVYDVQQKILKQDYIVDISSEHEQFILYTDLPRGMGHLLQAGVVHKNKDFFDKYGDNGKHYLGTHHPDISTLHPELQERIRKYLNLTGRELVAPPRG